MTAKQKSAYFNPPVQRQRWNETQILPHVNWGDLFFDLFYVAAAYNLAGVIKEDLSVEAILYFFALFGPLYYHFWFSKMHYDSKFQLPSDFVHTSVEVLQLVALALCVLSIRPAGLLKYGAENSSMAFYTGALLFGGSLIPILFIAEIRYVWVDGEEAAKHSATTDLIHMVPSLLINAAAFAYSMYVFMYGTKDVAYHGSMIILLSHWIIKPWFKYLVYTKVARPDFKNYSVPMNIDYAIHRYGEWTMLMLGESVLSLLIVNDVSEIQERRFRFYFTFLVGILSVILLQFLYFKAQPLHAKDHAMRRSRAAGFAYSFLIQVYSGSLILVGVSYKLMLTEYSLKYDEKEGGYRELAESSSSSSKKFELEERRQRISNFFCFSLAAVFLTLDLMLLAHFGFKKVYERVYCPERGRVLKMGVFIVGAIRLGLLGFIVTLSQYFTTDPEYVSLFGLFTIAAQVWVRFVGRIYFPQDEEHVGHGEHGGHEEAHSNTSHAPIEEFRDNQDVDLPQSTPDDFAEEIYDLARRG